jgi:hypothetical protein
MKLVTIRFRKKSSSRTRMLYCDMQIGRNIQRPAPLSNIARNVRIAWQSR